MSLFDSVMVECPGCKNMVEFQTHADECAYMESYTLENAPDVIKADIVGSWEICSQCGLKVHIVGQVRIWADLALEGGAAQFSADLKAMAEKVKND
jgi:hypothetical protein